MLVKSKICPEYLKVICSVNTSKCKGGSHKNENATHQLERLISGSSRYYISSCTEAPLKAAEVSTKRWSSIIM